MSPIVLTDDQKTKVLEVWNSRPENPPSIQELIKAVFGDTANVDGRGPYARAIKEFLASRQIVTTTISIHKPKGDLPLTEEDKQSIAALATKNSPQEIARIIFKNDKLNNLSQEARTVANYIKSLPKTTEVFEDPNDVPLEDYKAPKTLDRVVARVNKYVHDTEYDYKTLTPRVRKEMEVLISYLHDYRFIHQINTYQTEKDRDLFESEFVKYIFNKPDLTREDLNQYIILCIECVMSDSIQRTINMLQGDQDRIIGEGGRMSMQLVEAIGIARKEYNSSVDRQQKLFKVLNTQRAERLEGQIKDNATVLNLVSTWKTEDDRVKMIKYAQLRQEKLAEAIDELSEYDEVITRIFGFSKEEALYG